MTSKPLSVQGEQRRNEILRRVLDESRRIQRRRRRRRKLGGTAAMVLIVVTATWTFWSPAEPNVHGPQISRSRSQGTHSSSPTGFDLQRHLVRTDVDNLDDYIVRTHEQMPAGILLNDTQLLSALADLGRVEGLIRAGGKTWLSSELHSPL